MKNKISIFSIILVLGVFVVAGCSKSWLDINNDPNNSADATMELLFPSGVASVATTTGGYYNLAGGFWSQYWTQSNAANQYKYIDQYGISASDFNNIWQEMYVGALSDLQLTIEKAKVAENTSFLLMATVMQAYAWQFMTDFHGDIPYFEAFQGDAEVRNLSPKFDTQEAIYTDLLARLNEVLNVEEFTELTTDQAAQDMVFGGDIDQWIRFANTLKLKMYLRLAYKQPAVAQAGIQSLYSNGAEFLSTDAFLNCFIDVETKDNPLYAADKRNLNVGTNLRISSTIFRYFETNADPRLSGIIASNVVPMPQGGFVLTSAQMDPTTVAVFRLNATEPVYFISEVESYLLQAEAIERGWGTGDAKTLYDMAISADFARRGLGGGESGLIGAGGAYEYPTSGTFDEKLEAIIMAKWAAFTGKQCAESFFEQCRTGYPKVSTVPAWLNGAVNADYHGGALTYSLGGITGGLFPKRMVYPQDEANLNTNYPGNVAVTVPVWWDVN
jgi:hypothetical protein